jgi:hypothetical protein
MGNMKRGMTVFKVDDLYRVDSQGSAGTLGLSGTPPYEVGATIPLGDRVFKYCHYTTAAAILAGKLVQGPSYADTMTGYATSVVLTAAGTTAGVVVPASNGAAGTKVVWITPGGTVTADYFEGGYIFINYTSGNGLGQTRKIKTHPAMVSGTPCPITLYDAWTTTITTLGTVTAACVQNHYRNVVVYPGTVTTGAILGATVVDIPACSASLTAQYFWVQSWGPCAILTDVGTLTGGYYAAVSDDTAACCGPYESDAPLCTGIGVAITSGASGGYALINLTICR